MYNYQIKQVIMVINKVTTVKVRQLSEVESFPRSHSLHVKKAFDSFEHNFVKAILQKFNFGNTFLKWIDNFL